MEVVKSLHYYDIIADGPIAIQPYASTQSNQFFVRTRMESRSLVEKLNQLIMSPTYNNFFFLLSSDMELTTVVLSRNRVGILFSWDLIAIILVF